MLATQKYYHSEPLNRTLYPYQLYTLQIFTFESNFNIKQSFVCTTMLRLLSRFIYHRIIYGGKTVREFIYLNFSTCKGRWGARCDVGVGGREGEVYF